CRGYPPPALPRSKGARLLPVPVRLGLPSGTFTAFHKPRYLLQIQRCVHGVRPVPRRDHADRVASLDDAHHVHGFSHLQRSRSHARVVEQEVASERYYAYLLVHGHICHSRTRRNGFSGEVKGVAVHVAHDLDAVAILELLTRLDCCHEIDNLHRRVRQHRGERLRDHVRVGHGFITLHHHHDVILAVVLYLQ